MTGQWFSLGTLVSSRTEILLKVALNTINHHYHWLFLQISRHAKRKSQLEQINEMPLYPTEEIIWDENIVPTDFYSGDGLYAFYFLLFIFLMHQINHSKANFTLISYQKKKEI